MLSAWEIETVDAASGYSALEAMRQAERAFDCIILDAHMPKMDGYELADRLRASYPDLPPMLMLSSGAMRGDGQRCVSAGIAGFFSKPIASEDLLAALGRVFDDSNAPLPASDRPLINRHALHEVQRSLTVLLVEDHPVNQKLALGLLEKWGHKARLAVNGQEAFELYSHGKYDLILMDMQMPVMGGLEATRLIRALELEQQRPRTFVIAMTAAAMDDDRVACLAAGMDDYLSKPIKVKELFEKLLALSGRIESVESDSPGYDYNAALLAADRETVEIIADVFLDTWKRDIERLRDGVEKQDAAQIERTAHSFRGCLASFNAKPAVDISGQLEIMSRQQTMTDPSRLIDQLVVEIEALVPHLERIAKQISG
jgi:CheY-like chemotaxis protein